MVLLVAALAGLGAVARVTTARALGADARATLAVNLVGSFVLGVLTGAGVAGDAALLAGTAVLGSFTTFSAWMLEADELRAGDDAVGAARLVLLASAAGAVALAAGWALGAAP